jgi:hypothetical protein
MTSRGKKKTTMAKLNREARLRERRSEKVARKEARRDAAANPPQDDELLLTEDDTTADSDGDDVRRPGMASRFERASAVASQP